MLLGVGGGGGGEAFALYWRFSGDGMANVAVKGLRSRTFVFQGKKAKIITVFINKLSHYH